MEKWGWGGRQFLTPVFFLLASGDGTREAPNRKTTTLQNGRKSGLKERKLMGFRTGGIAFASVTSSWPGAAVTFVCVSRSVVAHVRVCSLHHARKRTSTIEKVRVKRERERAGEGRVAGVRTCWISKFELYLMLMLPGWGEAATRRSATEAPHAQPRSSTSSQEPHRPVVHRRSRSFSNVEFVIDHDGGGGGGDGRKQQQRRYPQQEQYRPRGQHHQPRYQPRVVDVGCRGVSVGFSRWSSFSYYRLPEAQIRLTIVKLDCSSFDVQVMKSASVSELKLAVEQIFTRSPRAEWKISWSHVWGHFCLSYKSQKLIDDKATLKAFGIKDGDELHFIRHVSVNYAPVKRHSRKHGGRCEQHDM